jgi:hypothetical protein
MKLKGIIQKIPFWVFCVYMSFNYYNGLLYPEQTNNWVENVGIFILVLEAFSLFYFLLSLPGPVLSKISPNGNTNIKDRIIILTSITFMTFVFLFITNHILLFFYFMLSNVVKYFSFRQIKTDSEINQAEIYFGTTIVSLVFSVFIALAISYFINYDVIGLWGLIYFLSLIFWNLWVYIKSPKLEETN